MLNRLEALKTQWDQTQDFRSACKNYDKFQEVFPRLSWDQVRLVLEKTSEKEFISALQAKSCEGRRVKSAKSLVSVMLRVHPYALPSEPEVARAFRQRIDEVLEGNRPVGLDVSAEFVGINSEFEHAVSIAGRRPAAGGKCEYLLRDSNDTCNSK